MTTVMRVVFCFQVGGGGGGGVSQAEYSPMQQPRLSVALPLSMAHR